MAGSREAEVGHVSFCTALDLSNRTVSQKQEGITLQKYSCISQRIHAAVLRAENA